MHISKTTFNFAEKRNLEIYVWEDEETVSITHNPEETDCAAVEFDITEEGFLVQSNVFNKELGNTCIGIIKTEKDFRRVLAGIALVLGE